MFLITVEGVPFTALLFHANKIVASNRIKIVTIQSSAIFSFNVHFMTAAFLRFETKLRERSAKSTWRFPKRPG